MPKKFYVVWAGRETGIFTSWSDTNKQVDRFPRSKFKSFKTRKEAAAAYAAGWGKHKSDSAKKTKKSTAKKSRTTSKPESPMQLDASATSTNCFDVQVYCDGACEPNPGQAGSGVAVYLEGNLSELWYGLYDAQGTNNTAELNALYQALLIAKEGIDNDKKVEVLCDSQYAINCITVWAFNWQEKGWKRKKPGDIKNLEIIQLAHHVYLGIKSDVVISHVSAHVGIEGNELADRMAVFGIDQQDIDFCRYSEKLDVRQILEFRAG